MNGSQRLAKHLSIFLDSYYAELHHFGEDKDIAIEITAKLQRQTHSLQNVGHTVNITKTDSSDERSHNVQYTIMYK